ncbi:MAG TPA: transposase domain-containing protein [Verrucomicrobiales bacterium]|nr:transposase domain-containing protein [Verrucomicrobiales bacterium]
MYIPSTKDGRRGSPSPPDAGDDGGHGGNHSTRRRRRPARQFHNATLQAIPKIRRGTSPVAWAFRPKRAFQGGFRRGILFFRAESGGKSAATFYTLTGNCRLLGIDPQEYLTDVLSRRPSMTNRTQHQLTPRNWLAERRGADLPADPALVPG